VELIQIYIHAEEHAEIAELRLLHIEGVKKEYHWIFLKKMGETIGDMGIM
jgi:hypothetical protein